MASAPKTGESAGQLQTLEDLEKAVNCFLCKEKLQDPKILPCLHYYCKACLCSLVQELGTNEALTCPKCNQTAAVPDNFDSFPDASFIYRMIDLYDKMAKVEGKVEATCGMCSGIAKAEAFCHQCSEFICSDCSRSHRKMRVFAGHEVKTLQELRESLEGSTPPEQFLMSDNLPLVCREHDEKLKFFCFQCNCPVCHDCVASKSHERHPCELTTTAVMHCKKRLEESLTPLQKIHTDTETAKKAVQAMKEEVSNQGSSLEESIRAAFTKLHEILDQHQQLLLDKTSKLVHQKLGTLNAQEQSLESASEEAVSLCTFIEQNLKYTRDEELIALHGKILTGVGQTCHKHMQRNLRVTEAANISMEVPAPSSLANLCQTSAAVFLDLPADPTKCVTKGPGTKVAEVDKPTTVVIHTVRADGQPCRGKQMVKLELRSLVEGSLTQIEGKPKSSQPGAYEACYNPKVRGRYILTAKVNGMPVTPTRVFVKLHPSKLRRPVRVTGGIWKPWGVCIDTIQDEILVSEQGSNQVTVMEKSGKKLTAIGSRTPSGLARDNEGCLYVAENRDSLLKYGKGGELLKVVKGKLCEPESVRVLSESIYVCDSGNHRVAVFTKELYFTRTLGSEGTRNGQFRNPQDIAQDKKGNLYVSDKRNRRVQVFTREGNFLRSFGVEHLGAPTGLCFSPDDFYLYVVDSRKGCITIFIASGGKFVTSFSRHGRNEGELNNPTGIAVDSDGFVYICDSGNDRLQVF